MYPFKRWQPYLKVYHSLNNANREQAGLSDVAFVGAEKFSEIYITKWYEKWLTICYVFFHSALDLREAPLLRFNITFTETIQDEL